MEMEILKRRQSGFAQFFSELMPVLADFIERLGLPQPAMVIAEPDMYVDGVAQFFANQIVEEEDRVWAITRLGYFIGELLNKRFGGCWYVNDDPEASTFSRYVVGQFQCCDNKKLSIDPMDAANRFLSEPMGRNFRQLLVDIETEMCDLGCSKRADG